MTAKHQSIVEAAILATKGLDQEQVARALGLHQATVSRRLKMARDLGYIFYPAPQLRPSNIDPEVLRSAEYIVSSGRLRDSLVRRLNALAGTELIRFLSIEQTTTSSDACQSWTTCLRTVCRSAGRRLPELLSRATRVGVAWGYTLRFIVDELQLQKPLDISKPPIVFPVVGTFPNTDQANPYPMALTSTMLAGDLAEVIHGMVPEDQVSLSSVPAYIPLEFDELREPLSRFYSKLPGFREVFGGPGGQHSKKYPEALMNTADMLITGLGDMPSKGGGSPYLRERLRLDGARHEDWSSITVGDISGVLLPRHVASKSQKDQISAVNRRFNGIGLGDLQSIAERCVQSGGDKPGVVAIAHYRAKAPIVLEAVRNRCVNRLFLDADLASELERITP